MTETTIVPLDTPPLKQCCMYCGYSSTNPMWLDSPQPWQFQPRVLQPPHDLITCRRAGSNLTFGRDWCGEFIWSSETSEWWHLPPRINLDDAAHDELDPLPNWIAARGAHGGPGLSQLHNNNLKLKKIRKLP